MHVTILTLFPEMFPGPLGHSLPGRARAEGLWSLNAVNIRDFATDKHHTVDDTPYGGGAGMVLKPEVVAAAIDAARAELPNAALLHFTPRGHLLTQGLVRELLGSSDDPVNGSSNCDFILLCGRFEGIDQRICEAYHPMEVSIGDYVLFGGELAAMVFLEAALRHLPGLLGNSETHHEESFAIGQENALLLEYPHYTKPAEWRGRAVPDILLSGHHEKISVWRRQQAEAITKACRPDLWEKYRCHSEHATADVGSPGDFKASAE